MKTPIELYLDSKSIAYHLDGNNAIAQCPFCKQGGKWGINIESGLHNCFRGSCEAKGNLKTLRRHFGDPVEEEILRSNLEDDSEPPIKTKRAPANLAEKVPDIDKFHALLLENDEVLNWLNDERGISLQTVKRAKLGLGKRKFQKDAISPALMFPYFEGEKLVGCKYRTLPPELDPAAPEKKDFRFTAGLEVGLYNQNAILKDMEALILCEGEIDALSLLEHGFENVIGVPGCKGKKVEWSDKLELPKKMYLVFDSDEAGQAGAREFAERFGIDRFCNVVIPDLDLAEPTFDGRTKCKDINEFFMLGKTKEDFQKLLDDARPFDLDGVVTADEAFENVIREIDNGGTMAPKYAFMWEPVQQRAKGINDSDLIVVLAAAKTGKTTWCLNQLAFMAQVYGLNIHFDCMEMEATDLIKKLTAMMLVKDEDTLTRQDIVDAQRMMRDWSGKFIFTRSSHKMMYEYLEFLRKVKRRYDIGARVVDNFQILVDLTIARNESRPNYMSQVSKKLKAISKELKSPTFLISQPKQLQEGQMVSVNDSEGSSTLTKDADLFFTLNRNPEVRMKLSEIQALGNLETNQSHSENMYVEVGLSRRSKGGICTLKIDGAKSIIREFESDESSRAEAKTMIGKMKIETADDEPVAV